MLVADDHELACLGLKSILCRERGFEIVGTAYDGQAAIRMHRELSPDITILDIRMPKMDGIQSCRSIKEGCPAAKLLMIDDENGDSVFAALEAGASGYLIKNFSAEELIHSVWAIHEGQFVFDPLVARKLIRRFVRGASGERTRIQLTTSLTKRELEILGFVGCALNNRAIADHLFLSEGTVKTHVSSILRKLAKRDRTELALFAFKQGLASRVISVAYGDPSSLSKV